MGNKKANDASRNVQNLGADKLANINIEKKSDISACKYYTIAADEYNKLLAFKDNTVLYENLRNKFNAKFIEVYRQIQVESENGWIKIAKGNESLFYCIATDVAIPNIVNQKVTSSEGSTSDIYCIAQSEQLSADKVKQILSCNSGSQFPTQKFKSYWENYKFPVFENVYYDLLDPITLCYLIEKTPQDVEFPTLIAFASDFKMLDEEMEYPESTRKEWKIFKDVYDFCRSHKELKYLFFNRYDEKIGRFNSYLSFEVHCIPGFVYYDSDGSCDDAFENLIDHDKEEYEFFVDPSIILSWLLDGGIRLYGENDKKLEKLWDDLRDFYGMIKDLIAVDENGVKFIKKINSDNTESLSADLSYRNKLLELIGVVKTIYYANLDREIASKNKILDIDSGLQKKYEADLLAVDNKRCNLEVYSRELLINPNKGMWELYEQNIGDSRCKVALQEPWYARNPNLDIKENAIVGIDFGTKNTVAVYQDDFNITEPIRIGSVKMQTLNKKNEFENPTVLQFVDLKTFLKDYNAAAGRPNTKWKDAITSHDAANKMEDKGNGDIYYSFISNLKQWAGEKGKKLRVRDERQTQDITLQPYLELKENDFDPIAVYAYYLGLYLNNQTRGIFLKYLLSYPVNYSKDVRERIVKSFEKGLKKSLPISVLANKEAMGKFSVSLGGSEPSSYAACALQAYGLGSEESKTFYGIFDFGGGTTDFDFGSWEWIDGRYDYRLTSFGYGGDRYLGGENLLELLAYKVFCDNRQLLGKSNVKFTLPDECRNEKFPGWEGFIDNESQKANYNTKQLVKMLRPFWEEQKMIEEEEPDSNIESVKSKYDQSGKKVKANNSGYSSLKTINSKASLMSEAGTNQQVELTINYQNLYNTLKARIEEGVNKFITQMVQAFSLPSAKGVDKVNILLAGNSCKSGLVTELLDKHLTELQRKTEREAGIMVKFEVLPPLGSEAANQIIKANSGEMFNKHFPPNMKTGVAYGLVECRRGGKIQVENKNNTEDNEVKFSLYIGYEKRKKFKTVINAGDSYNKWFEFMETDCEKEFELYFTDNPEARKNSLSIASAKRLMCKLGSIFEKGIIVIRAVGFDKIEYAVAGSAEDADNGKFLLAPKAIEVTM